MQNTNTALTDVEEHVSLSRLLVLLAAFLVVLPLLLQYMRIVRPIGVVQVDIRYFGTWSAVVWEVGFPVVFQAAESVVVVVDTLGVGQKLIGSGTDNLERCDFNFHGVCFWHRRVLGNNHADQWFTFDDLVINTQFERELE